MVAIEAVTLETATICRTEDPMLAAACAWVAANMEFAAVFDPEMNPAKPLTTGPSTRYPAPIPASAVPSSLPIPVAASSAPRMVNPPVAIPTGIQLR